jgi:hypothetical protein
VPPFSILFAGVVSTFVYNPRKKNRKSAKIIPKIDEALITQEVYMDEKLCFREWFIIVGVLGFLISLIVIALLNSRV